MAEQAPEIAQDFQGAIDEMLRLDPGRGFAFRIERAHFHVEQTKRGTLSRKEALHSIFRLLAPYFDSIFRDGYAALLAHTKKMLRDNNPRASTHYEDGLEVLLNELEFRKGFHGQKDIYDEPL